MEIVILKLIIIENIGLIILKNSKELAKKSFNQIENNKSMKHSARTLFKISKALGVKTNWLLGIEEEKQIKKIKTS